jgi:YfiH family protein
MDGATAVFSTRLGGVSRAPFDSLNLGIFTEDERDAVIENRSRLAAALGFASGDIAIARQVHGAELVTHDVPQTPSPFADPGCAIAEADGHVTSQLSLPLLVFVADCVPVALAGPGGVAMLHCGRRGLAAGIVGRGVEAVGATEAAIGPAIGPCCYEVGEEVLNDFAGLGPGVASGRMLDLPEATRQLLDKAGVERIESSDLCTSCEPELFFSHRRDAGRTGRQAGLVWRDEEGG